MVGASVPQREDMEAEIQAEMARLEAEMKAKVEEV